LLAPDAMVQVGDAGVRVPDITGAEAKDAVTVQLFVIAPVVYVVPESKPPQPVTEDIEYPAFGVTVNDLVLL